MNKNSVYVKLLLTIPALGLGIWQGIKKVSTVTWYFIQFVSKILGISYILKPVIALWQSPVPIPEPEPEPEPEEKHDFH